MELQRERILEVRGISKSFGDNKVIDDLSFEIGRGEFLTVLGSSGCGKTTLLRIICGLCEADGGQVLIDGVDVTSLEPNKRNVNTVFQNYALFPHMTVYDNIAYPLRMKKTPKSEIKRRVAEVLELVRMSGFERRYPASLSGGQKQRIAIARAVVAEPAILLLDEPLGALDLNLRRQMQSELKGIQKRLGITFIYITHDQEEALGMSDRVAVMRGGKFLQIGTPDEIYSSPSTVYTARFVGEANIIPAIYVGKCDGGSAVRWSGGIMNVRDTAAERSVGDLVNVALRAEHVAFEAVDDADGVITDTSFAGGVMHITADMGGVSVTSVRYGLDRSLSVGERVQVHISPLAGIVCSPDGGEGTV